MKNIHPCLKIALFWIFIIMTWGQRVSVSYAQDIHYTQFYSDVLRLNPAMTGNFNGDYRVGLNTRSQWRSVTVPYQTISAYADLAFLKKQQVERNGKGKQHWLGVGLRTLYDRAGDGRLAKTEVQGLVAGHLSLSEQLYLSAGAGATFVQKSIGYEALYFSSQWNGVDFIEATGSGELLEENRFSQLALQGGLTLSYHYDNRLNVYVGGSMLHLNRPKDSFLGGDNTTAQRLMLQAGASIWATDRLGVEPAAYYSHQRKASEWLLGTNIFYAMGSSSSYETENTSAKIYAGAWYRVGDALAVLAGVEFLRNRLLFSYDINLSSLKTASQGRGGPELSFVHMGSFRHKKSNVLYCPRF